MPNINSISNSLIKFAVRHPNFIKEIILLDNSKFVFKLNNFSRALTLHKILIKKFPKTKFGYISNTDLYTPIPVSKKDQKFRVYKKSLNEISKEQSVIYYNPSSGDHITPARYQYLADKNPGFTPIIFDSQIKANNYLKKSGSKTPDNSIIFWQYPADISSYKLRYLAA